MNKKYIIIASVVIIGFGLFLWTSGRLPNLSRNGEPSLTSSGVATVNPTSNSLGTPSGKDLQSLTPAEVEKLVGGGGFVQSPDIYKKAYQAGDL